MLIEAGKHFVNPNNILVVSKASYANSDPRKVEGVRHGLTIMFDNGKRLSWGTSETVEEFIKRVEDYLTSM